MWHRELTAGWLPPSIGDDTLVVPIEEGGIAGLDASTSRVNWRAVQELASGFGGASPLVVDATVYMPLGVALYAIDVATGAIRWRFPTGLPSESTPAVAGETVSFTGDDTYLYALDATDGTQRWRRKTDAQIRANVTTAAASVYVATKTGTVYAVKRETGAVRWTTGLSSEADDGVVRPGMIATDGSRIYVLFDDALVALAAATGDQCWRRRDVPVRYNAGLAICDGAVYVYRRDGLDVLEAATGEERRRIELDDYRAGPTIADGALYAIVNQELVRYQ